MNIEELLNGGRGMLKRLVKKMVMGYKADGESYLAFLKRGGAEIGENVRIFTPSQTHIDDQALHLLHIGSNVVLTGSVTILTHDYSSFVCMRRFPERERAVAAMRPVTIGDNVFIGWGATILPGAIIGDNTIIGAGAVVSGVIEPDSVYAGNPAKKLMTIDEFYNRRIDRQVEEASRIYVSYLSRFGKEPKEECFYGYESIWNKSKYSYCRWNSYSEFCSFIKKKMEDKEIK